MLALVERSVAEYEAMLRRWRAEGAKLYATFLHHTWVPHASCYRGRETMLGVQRAHRARGFSDIACHVYTTPDGTVWPARPVTTRNCACQAPTRSWGELPQSLRKLISQTRGTLQWERWPNRYGFSVETVGQFDWPTPTMRWSEDPTQSVAMRTSLDVLAIVHRLWDIPPEHCYFHRDVAVKTCPGTRVTREWVQAELRRRMDMVEPEYDEWAAEAVLWAQRTGVMQGREMGFAGREPVTRQELAVALFRLFRLLEVQVR